MLRPFSRFCVRIGAIPESIIKSLSYEEQLIKLVNYLKDTVTPAIDDNADAIEELQTTMTELETYVNDYFDNLDVQEEINNKLDEMAEDGELTTLIKNYVDPIYEEFETNINNSMDAFETTVNSTIDTMNNKVDSAVSGSPLVASSTSEMLDTTRVYVNTTDGKWYYYDGDSWEIGGTYQATVENYDTTLTVNNHTPNSRTIGDKINDNVYTNNLFDKNNYVNNYYINGSGVLVSDDRYFISNIIKLKNGDTVYPYSWVVSGDVPFRPFPIFRVSIVSALGEWISNVSPSPNQYYTATSDCYVKLIFTKTDGSISQTSDIENYVTIGLNTPNNSNQLYKYILNENEQGLDDISEYINVFDPNDFLYKGSINANGYMTLAPSYFTTNLIKCKSGDVFYLKYFNNDENIVFYNVAKYDTNKHFTTRSSVNAKSFTANFDGYVKFTCYNPNLVDDIGSYLVISKNQEVTSYVPHSRSLKDLTTEINDVSITKIDSTNYVIKYGDFKVTLFKTESVDNNQDNWNLKNISDKLDHIIVPTGTDIIGPVKINDNSDFIGGVHGDETTDYVKVAINNEIDDLEDVTYKNGKSLTLIMKSTVYDQDLQTKAFDRYVTIEFTTNKMHISNSFKAATNLTLKSAPIGGLIAARNNIIDSIMFNNSFYATAPTSSVGNSSKYNTTATLNTEYGSITVNNIKGYNNENYSGYLAVFSNESPIRCKIYFMVYKEGTYSISSGDIINGEFEYICS